VNDDRVRALLAGAGLGLALVLGIYLLRPPLGTIGDPGGLPAGPLASYPPLMEIEELYAAFHDLPQARSAGSRMTLGVLRVADLNLPTGRVVANDAFFIGLDDLALTRRLGAGRHPVYLLEAESPQSGERVAAAMIRAAPGDPVSWEMASVPGQDPADLAPGEVFTYGVDSGTGSFASLEAAQTLEASGEDGYAAYADSVVHGMYPGEGLHSTWTEAFVDPSRALNVIAIASGYGDGGYPSFFGLDEDGEPLVLVTDFGILDAARD
jgi:hypothetical protein